MPPPHTGHRLHLGTAPGSQGPCLALLKGLPAPLFLPLASDCGAHRTWGRDESERSAAAVHTQ